VGDFAKYPLSILVPKTNAYTHPLYWRIKVHARSESSKRSIIYGDKNIIHAHVRERFPSA